MIEHESRRLEQVNLLAKLRSSELVDYIVALTDAPLEQVAGNKRECDTIEKLVSRLVPIAKNPTKNLIRLDELLTNFADAARRDLTEARRILGLETPGSTASGSLSVH